MTDVSQAEGVELAHRKCQERLVNASKVVVTVT